MAKRVDISIRGMSCASCVGRVERALKKQPDVTDAQVNLTTEKATVAIEEHANPEQMVQAVE